MTTTRKSDDAPSASPRLHAAAPYISACLIVIALFAVLEVAHPYYFLQDDNRDSFLPLFVHNYRAVSDGQLPQFNFYQSLGRPQLANGWSAALQPFNYAAIFLSELAFDDVFASIDILTLIYLLFGACGVVFLIRLLGSSPAAGVFAATTWCFTPFNMMTSQAWATYSPVIGLLPWIVIGALLVYRERYWSGGILFVLTHLLLFFVGAPQFFLYAALMEAAFVAWLAIVDVRAGRVPLRRLVRTAAFFAAVTVFVTALCMPLFLPMWSQMKYSAHRSEDMSVSELGACEIPLSRLANGLLFPFVKLYPPTGGEWCDTYPPVSFTHIGYAALILASAFPWIRRKVPETSRSAFTAAFAIGVLLLLAALGTFSPLAAVVPVVNRFRWPFKYFGFACFPLAISAAPAFDALLSRWSRSTRGLMVAAGIIALQAANLVSLDATFVRQAFLEHLDPVPLHEPLRPMLATSRTVGVGGCRLVEKLWTAHTMGYDYATLWELHYFGGYDPLVPLANLQLTLGLDYQAVLCGDPARIPVDYLRQWGVAHYIVNLDRPRAKEYEATLLARGLRRVHADPRRVVLFDPAALPLVGGPGCTLRELGRVGDDLTASVVCRRDAPVTLRFLFNPYFFATVDGAAVALREGDGSQLLVPVPKGTHTIRIRYDDPLIAVGGWIALFAIAVALVIAVLLRSKR